jgi:hypothetical protein
MEFPLIGRINLILSTFSSCGLFFLKLRFFVVHITFLDDFGQLLGDPVLLTHQTELLVLLWRDETVTVQLGR